MWHLMLQFSIFRPAYKRVSAVAISHSGHYVAFADKFGVVWLIEIEEEKVQRLKFDSKPVPILGHYCSIITRLVLVFVIPLFIVIWSHCSLHILLSILFVHLEVDGGISYLQFTIGKLSLHWLYLYQVTWDGSPVLRSKLSTIINWEGCHVHSPIWNTCLLFMNGLAIINIYVLFLQYNYKEQIYGLENSQDRMPFSLNEQSNVFFPCKHFTDLNTRSYITKYQIKLFLTQCSSDIALQRKNIDLYILRRCRNSQPCGWFVAWAGFQCGLDSSLFELLFHIQSGLICQMN